MILRSNKKLLDEYLVDLREQVSEASVRSVETHLHAFLDFLDETPLEQSPAVAKSYKSHLRSGASRRDGKDKPLSTEYIRKNLTSVRAFMAWLRDEKDYDQIKDSWLKRNLRVTAKESNQAGHNPDEDGDIYFSVEEAVQIAHTPVNSLGEERIRAACIFLLLSGMRITAFLTMPILAVDVDGRKIKQWTSLGVRTKLSKSATTTLIQISQYPELMNVLRVWDEKVRSALPEAGMWFANILPITGELDPSTSVGKYRSSGFRRDLVKFLEKAGIEYKSPHKFRHGHIRFLRSRAKNAVELEAIARNAMQNLNTMLKYGKLGNKDSRVIVDSLCSDDATQPDTAPPTLAIDPDYANAFRQIETILAEIKRQSGGHLA